MAEQAKRNVLVIYSWAGVPFRATNWDYLQSFQRHGNDRYFYFNHRTGNLPKFVSEIRFDAIIFTVLFSSDKWDPAGFAAAAERVAVLKDQACPKLLFVQDEYFNIRAINEFIAEFGITDLFTVSPESEWSKFYPHIDQEKVRVHKVLTGYLDTARLRRIEHLAQQITQRDIDVGYRAWRAGYWLGSQGQLKAQVGRAADPHVKQLGLTSDISTATQDTLLGDRWYEFLLRCKISVGCEGGSSLLDWDGSLKAKVDQYCAKHPQATFDETLLACCPGRDGELAYAALSPRHLECCATRTLQVLVEAEYDGVLKPWEHYIPINKDFSNIREALETAMDAQKRKIITERAYQDIVASQKYTYERLINDVVERIYLAGAPRSRNVGFASLRLRLHQTMANLALSSRYHLTTSIAWRVARWGWRLSKQLMRSS